MHELSICEALLDEVERLARAQGARRVGRIVLRIGPLSGVEPALLRQAFPLAAAATCAEGARLEIEPAPVRVYCLDCGHENEAAPNRLLCAACGSCHTRLLGGDELLLLRLELDLDD
ncbi:MAG: hydrogenase maturation nickel metallochaperone HypA [Chromatiaceae bacterium]|nr:hydrogenase maturation nickel metallochaperone HypA [Chromatiaceae bacterium]